MSKKIFPCPSNLKNKDLKVYSNIAPFLINSKVPGKPTGYESLHKLNVKFLVAHR